MKKNMCCTLFFILFSVLFPHCSQPQTMQWTNVLVDSSFPSRNFSTAYNSTNNTIYLYGGFMKFDSRFPNSDKPPRYGDLFEWDGTRFNKVFTTSWKYADNRWIPAMGEPSPRAYHAMAYDSNRKRLVIFGGSSDYESDLGDTWEWDGNEWIEYKRSGPPAGEDYKMVFDEKRGKIVLYGGFYYYETPGKRISSDTWEWDGNLWLQVADTGPGPRLNFNMVYDASRQKVILFGGALQTEDLFMEEKSDLWEWDGIEWKQISKYGPPGRSGSEMIYDSDRNKIIIFGGGAAPGGFIVSYCNETLEWDGNAWKLVSDVGPLYNDCYNNSMIYDIYKKQILLFSSVSDYMPEMIHVDTLVVWKLEPIVSMINKYTQYR